MAQQEEQKQQLHRSEEEESPEQAANSTNEEQQQQKRQAHRSQLLPRMALNSVDLPYSSDEDEAGDPRPSAAALAAACSPSSSPCCSPGRSARFGGLSGEVRSPGFLYAPSCVEDFSQAWLLCVMQKYYENNGFKDGIKEIGQFSVERSDSSTSSDQEHHSHHVLSQAYKVMVDIPDPPQEEVSAESEQTKDSGVNGDVDDLVSATTPPCTTAEEDKKKVHHLFVKVPPKRTAKFERMVRRNRTLEHEVKVYTELLVDLQKFVKDRTRDVVQLKIPKLYHGQQSSPSSSGVGGGDATGTSDLLVIEDLTKKGFRTKDWFKHKLEHAEVMLAVKELAKFHACGLAYRMSLKEEIDEKYPYLEDDLYTSNMAKELLAKYLDSYLHFLSLLPGIQEHVHKLRKISGDVFQLLVKLRRPTDPLGTRFNTVCHGDMWMGNVMFKGTDECTIVDFHSAQFLSPATDLAHLLLTSTTRAYRQEHWNTVVQSYYDTFNETLAEFGLILRHLGTTYQDFLYEVKRALRGQFLCVAFIIPIVIYCGPMEWRFERRRGSSVDRKNTVRHLIQMMAITEEQGGDSPESEDSEEGPDGVDLAGIPPEFLDLYKDKELTQILVDLMHTAADLDILDFAEFCKNIGNPRPMWTKTQATTGKHIPVY